MGTARFDCNDILLHKSTQNLVYACLLGLFHLDRRCQGLWRLQKSDCRPSLQVVLKYKVFIDKFEVANRFLMEDHELMKRMEDLTKNSGVFLGKTSCHIKKCSTFPIWGNGWHGWRTISKHGWRGRGTTCWTIATDSTSAIVIVCNIVGYIIWLCTFICMITTSDKYTLNNDRKLLHRVACQISCGFVFL